MRFSRRLFTAAGGLLLSAALVLPASAAEGTISCTYIPITESSFVADTMDGVEARYNLDGATLYCVELVERYYREVYGLELRCDDGLLTVLNSTDFYFEPTDNPQPGDILYGSPAARGKNYSHWALVRANNGDSLTLFEQNWLWNGQAGIDRVISFPTTCYEAYTLKSRSGAPVRTVSVAAAEPSTWAVPYIQRAAETGVAELKDSYQSSVTRESFCRMALNVLARRGTAVPAGESACISAAALGLVSNTDGALPLTREEAAVIAARLAGRIGALPAAERTVLDFYADAAEISPWAADAVASMTACGLMSGAEGSFHPKGHMTNEQAAALLVRLDENPVPAVTLRSASFTAAPLYARLAAGVDLRAGNILRTRLYPGADR